MDVVVGSVRRDSERAMERCTDTLLINEDSMRSRANTGVGLSRIGEQSSIYRTIVRRDPGVIRYAGARWLAIGIRRLAEA